MSFTTSDRLATDDLDPPAARVLREALVRELVVEGDARSPCVIAALRAVPRHLFVPEVSLARAYDNHAIAISYDQTISQPAVVAAMTEALELSGRERVLEIGTGSGYQAAVLSRLAKEVLTIERIAPLADEAAQRLSRLGYANVHVRIGDGYLGWPERAPFDRIIVTAAPPELPQALVDQLADPGILVAPVGGQGFFEQRLVRARKRGGRVELEELGGVSFVEMLHGEARD